MAQHTVVLLSAAERERRKLPAQQRDRVNAALLALETNLRPEGTAKLRGAPDRWRIRVGDYRIIYRIDDDAQRVTVLRIAHRREVYR
ncbi:MAG: type II toxin-antitoxin system RelE/ParE family toxin [Chloroflexi bacterium]|nr:type II toxin-antitoxin system RelE/ParE family toxin [Chloroflexota bacterium]